MSQCHAEKLGCYHLGQGHRSTMNMIVSTVFSELMILLQT